MCDGHVPWLACGSEQTIMWSGSRFSPSTYIWVLKVALMFSGFQEEFLPAKLSGCPALGFVPKVWWTPASFGPSVPPCLSQPRCFLPTHHCCMHDMGFPLSRSPPTPTGKHSPVPCSSLSFHPALCSSGQSCTLLFRLCSLLFSLKDILKSLPKGHQTKWFSSTAPL